MSSSNKFIFFLIVLAVVINFYFYRAIFYYKFESEYLENWYYNSQYNVAQSTRGISDGILYQFVGYRLVEGENPFDLQYETPPFGKYLYGLAEKYFANPFITTVLIYLLSVPLFFYFANKILDKTIFSLLATLLFVTTPLFSTQLRETMLDLPYLFFYLLHGTFMIRFLTDKKRIDLILAGLFLGIASGTKLGVYTPFIILVCIMLISVHKGRLINFFIFPISVIVGYLIAFFEYFIRHPNPIPWLRLHKKVFDFYSSGIVNVDHLSQWKNIFLANLPNIEIAKLNIQIREWSIVAPLGVIAAVVGLVYGIKKVDLKICYVSAVVIIMLGVNTVIPFSPRYLIQMVPFLVLLIVYILKKYKILLIGIILLNIFSLFNLYSTNQLIGHSEAVARFLSTRAYRELYRSIDPQQRQLINEAEFIKTSENFFESLNTRKIEVKVAPAKRFDKEAKLKYNFRYFTKYGEIEREEVLSFKQVYGEWRLVWNWDYLYPRFNPESKISIEEKGIPFSKLTGKEGEVLAERAEGKTVYIIPRLMYDRGKSTNSLSIVTSKSSGEISATLATTIPDDFPRYVGYLDPALKEQGIIEALSIKGVSLRDNQFARIADSVKDPSQVSNILNYYLDKNPEVFYTNADIFITNKDGEKKPIKFKNGNLNDVTLKFMTF